MKSGFTVGWAAKAKAAGVAAALVCAASSSMAGATLSITSFTVSTAEFSGNFAWPVDAYQSLTMNALQRGGLAGSGSDSYTANDWNLGLNRTATVANASATGNTVNFTDALTQLTTAGFNLSAQASAGSYVPGALPNYGNASALQSGAFMLLDENGALTGGTLTFDIYYNLDVSAPDGSPTGYSQSVVDLLSSSDGGGSATFSDNLVSPVFGSGSKQGHFSWTYTLAAGEAAYYTLSGSAISQALAEVPEPSTIPLVALALAGMTAITTLRRRGTI